MATDDDDIWHQYAVDGAEAVRDIEASLLALEENASSAEHINRLYRGLHTLKGNSGFIGLAAIEQLADAAEGLIGLVRDHGVALTPAMVDLLLEVVDALRGALQVAADTRADPQSAELTALTARTRDMASELGAPDPHDPGPLDGPGFELFEEAAVPPPSPNRKASAPVHRSSVLPPVADVEAFLAAALDAVPRLGAAVARFSSGQDLEQGRDELAQLTRDLAASAAALGYVRLEDLLARFAPPALAGITSGARVAEAERDLYAALVTVEEEYRTLTPTPRDFMFGVVYRRACADAALADMALLRDVLDAPEAPQPAALHTIFSRLRHACEHHRFVRGARAALELEDLLSRAVEAGEAPPAEGLQKVRAFVEALGQATLAIHSDQDPEDLPWDAPPQGPPVLSAAAAALPMGDAVRRQLTASTAVRLEAALAAGHKVVEVHADVEGDADRAQRLTAWARSSGVTMLASAMVPLAEGAQASRMLMAVAPTAHGPDAALSALAGAKHAVQWKVLVAGGAPLVVATGVPAPAAPSVAPATPAHPVPSRGNAPALERSAVRATDDPDGERESHSKAEFLRVDARKVSLIMDLAGEIGWPPVR